MGALIKNGINYTGGSGASSYNELNDKPSIENVTLSGNKSASDLGFVKDSDLASVAKSGSYDDLDDKPTIPSDLDDMSDVELTTPTDGQVLKYNSTSGKWENGTGGGGGGSYTAGDGISIENDEISIDPMPAEDVDEVIDIYPTAGNLVSIVNAFNRGDLYSTDEKMIGQWIDGKPLYQRVIPITATYSGLIYDQTIATISDYNFINVVQFLGYVRGLKSGTVVSRPICYPHPNANWITNAYINERGEIKICVAQSTNIVNPIFIIQYTKTTDTAISIGSETEYSTEEKVVGTWIDGKPIWQKSFQIANVSGQTGWVIIGTILGIDTLVNGNIVVRDTGNVFAYTNLPICREFNNDNIKFYNCLGGNMGTVYGYATIQYTKTI